MPRAVGASTLENVSKAAYSSLPVVLFHFSATSEYCPSSVLYSHSRPFSVQHTNAPETGMFMTYEDSVMFRVCGVVMNGEPPGFFVLPNAPEKMLRMGITVKSHSFYHLSAQTVS